MQHRVHVFSKRQICTCLCSNYFNGLDATSFWWVIHFLALMYVICHYLSVLLKSDVLFSVFSHPSRRVRLFVSTLLTHPRGEDDAGTLLVPTQHFSHCCSFTNTRFCYYSVEYSLSSSYILIVYWRQALLHYYSQYGGLSTHLVCTRLQLSFVKSLSTKTHIWKLIPSM